MDRASSYRANGSVRYAWWDGAAWQSEVVESPHDMWSYGWKTTLAFDQAGQPHMCYQIYRIWSYDLISRGIKSAAK